MKEKEKEKSPSVLRSDCLSFSFLSFPPFFFGSLSLLVVSWMSGAVRESRAVRPAASAASARQQGVVSGLFKVMSIVAPQHAACALQPLLSPPRPHAARSSAAD